MLRIRTRSVTGIAILLTFILGGAAGAQNALLNFEPPPPEKFRAVIASLPPPQRDAINSAIADVIPVYVFLPGVMGSKLTKQVGQKTKVIWGEAESIFGNPDPDLAYNPDDKVAADVLSKYYALGANDVYGKALQTLKAMDLSGDQNVFEFAYDWRQSNVKSAADFSSWLCDNREKIGKRSIVFIAHSMGGLVLEYWLKHHIETDACDGGQKFSDWVKVKKLIFLGTPNFGAPKAVMAFADKFYLFVDPETLKGKLLGALDTKWLARSVNAFGATFPSAYQLLPVVNTTTCFNNPNWPYPVWVKPQGMSPHHFIDIFRVNTWKQMKWPRQLDERVDRTKFVNERLQPLLDEAKAFLCDLAEFEPEKKYDVTRFYGTSQKTICKVTLMMQSGENEPPEPKRDFCIEKDKEIGDGTVPKWSAAESERANVDSYRGASSEHMYLLNSDEFLSYLEDYRRQLHGAIQDNVKKHAGNIDGLVNMYASLRYVVPSAAGARDDTSAEVARAVVARLSIDPRLIYAAAKNEPDPLDRANAYRVFADTAQTGDTLAPWALTNAAHILLNQGANHQAILLGQSAVSTAGQFSDMTMANAVNRKAALTTAVAAERLNRGDLAKFYGHIAYTAGNQKAARFNFMATQ